MPSLKERATSVHRHLKPFGFRKRRHNFSKSDGSFFRLINLQGSSYEHCFYVNLGVHLIGLPDLTTADPGIRDAPPEYGCTFRARLEQAVPAFGLHALYFGRDEPQDELEFSRLLKTLSEEALPWLSDWCSYQKILDAPSDQLAGLLTDVPILQTKRLEMIRAFCADRLGQQARAAQHLQEFLRAEVPDHDFSLVEALFSRMITGPGSQS